MSMSEPERISEERLQYIIDRENALSIERMSDHGRQYSLDVLAMLRELQSIRARLTQVEAGRDAMRKALQFYADEGAYRGGFDDDGGGHFDQYGYDILDDKGATAKAALSAADAGRGM